MGSRRIESLTDCAAYGLKIHARCRCGHAAVLEPSELIADCIKRRRSAKLSAVYRRLRCADCAARPEWVGTD